MQQTPHRCPRRKWLQFFSKGVVTPACPPSTCPTSEPSGATSHVKQWDGIGFVSLRHPVYSTKTLALRCAPSTPKASAHHDGTNSTCQGDARRSNGSCGTSFGKTTEAAAHAPLTYGDSDKCSRCVWGSYYKLRRATACAATSTIPKNALNLREASPRSSSCRTLENM